MPAIPRSLLAVILCAALAALSPAGVRAQQSPAPSASAQQAPIPLPSPVPAPDDPQRHKFVVKQFLAWQEGNVDRSLYSDQVNEELTDEVLEKGTATLANMGALQSATFLGVSHAKPGDIYVYKITCEHGTIDMDFALDAQGKVAVIFFQ